MLPLNILYSIIVFIIVLFTILKLSKKHSNKKVVDRIALLCVVFSTIFLVFIGLYLLFPLDMMRFISGDKNIPTSKEYASIFQQVNKAITPYSTKGYVTNSEIPAILDSPVLDSSLVITLPDKCGYFESEINELNDDLATKEINRINKILNSSDEDLIAAFRNLNSEKQKELRLGGLDNLGSTSDDQLADSIRKCALKKLAYFDSFATNTKTVLFSSLKNKNLFRELKALFDKKLVIIDSEDIKIIIDLLYSPDTELRTLAKEILTKIDSKHNEKLLSYLSSNNPNVLTAITNSFKVKKNINQEVLTQEVIEAVYNLAENSVYDYIVIEAFDTYLLLSSSLDKEFERKLNLSLKLLSNKDEKFISSVIEVLKSNIIIDISLANKLYQLFNLYKTEELRISIVNILGFTGKISSKVLSDIAYESFYKVSDTLFQNYSFRGNVNHKDSALSCTVEETEENTVNDLGVSLNEWKLMPKCPVGEVDPSIKIIINSCEDPGNKSILSAALMKAIAKTEGAATQYLIKHLDSSNHIYKAFLYNGIITASNLDKNLYDKVFSINPKKEHLWNLVRLVKIANYSDNKLAKNLLLNITKNKMFGTCIKNKSFNDHYLSLGKEILE